jgi:hypothetical protein
VPDVAVADDAGAADDVASSDFGAGIGLVADLPSAAADAPDAAAAAYLATGGAAAENLSLGWHSEGLH